MPQGKKLSRGYTGFHNWDKTQSHCCIKSMRGEDGRAISLVWRTRDSCGRIRAAPLRSAACRRCARAEELSSADLALPAHVLATFDRLSAAGGPPCEVEAGRLVTATADVLANCSLG